MISDKTKHLVSQCLASNVTVTLEKCNEILSDRSVSCSTYLITMQSCSLLEQSVTSSAIKVYQRDSYEPYITNVVTKYADQLILDIGGCVCGISSATLKVVPKYSVSS